MPARKGPEEFDKCRGRHTRPSAVRPSAAPGLAKVAQGQSPRSTHNLTVMADASRAKGLICHLVQNDPSDTRRMPRLTDACRTMLVSRPGARNHLALA